MYIKNNVPIYLILLIIFINAIFILSAQSILNETKKYISLENYVGSVSHELIFAQLIIKDIIHDENNIVLKNTIKHSFEYMKQQNKQFNKLYSKKFNIFEEEKIVTEVRLINKKIELIEKELNTNISDSKHARKLDNIIKVLDKKLESLYSEIKILIKKDINNYSNNFIFGLLLFFILNIIVLTMYFYYRNLMMKLLKTIRTSEERLKYAVEATRDGLWDWNLETDEVYYSPRWKEILGYKDDEIPNIFHSWENNLHPDDLKKAKQEVSLSHHKQGVLFENIHRLKHKDGHWIWALSRGQTIFDENNKAVRMIGFYSDITEQKIIEDELLASKQQFECFTENFPAMVSIRDNDGNIVYVNKALKHFLKVDNMIGRKSSEFISKETLKQLNALIAEAKEKGYADTITEYTDLDTKTSIYRVMAFKIGEEYSHIGVMYFNITKEYRDQHKVAIFKQVLENSPVSIIITNVDGNIEYVNPWFCDLTGYALEEVIGKNPRILKSDYHTSEDYMELWDNISNNQVWSGTFKNIKKNGDEYWESSIIAPVHNEKSEIIKYIGIKKEITEQVHLREKLANKEDIIISQSHHAAMGEMIGMIAHQWRQPLSVIAMGANNLLIDIDLEELNQESTIEEAQSIIKQTEYLSKTIDDFRNFFRPNKEIEEVAVDEVISEANRIIGKSLEHKQITLLINHKTSYKVNTYSRELLQVFINIFKNAEEVLVEKRENNRYISIDITNDEENVITTISDNGGGINKKIIDKIFDPYFSTKNKKTGTGLGLHMSKTIIENHLNGTIKVYNIKDGTCFKISIPMKWKE